MVAAHPLPFSPEAIPATLEDFPPETQAAILAYETKRAAGTWRGVPHEDVMRGLAAQTAATEKVAKRFRARGLGDAILFDGTTEEVRAYCAATFGADDGPAAWLTADELTAFFGTHGYAAVP